jgi:hypothetical protein
MSYLSSLDFAAMRTDNCNTTAEFHWAASIFISVLVSVKNEIVSNHCLVSLIHPTITMPPQKKNVKHQLDRRRRKKKAKQQTKTDEDELSFHGSSSDKYKRKNEEESSSSILEAYNPSSKYIESDEEEEDYIPQRKRTSARRQKESDSDSNYHEDEQQESDDEHDEDVALSQLSQSKSPASSIGQKPRKRGRKKKSEESDDDYVNQEDEEESSAEEKEEDSDYAPASERHTKAISNNLDSSSSEEDISLTSPSNRTRKSSRRVIQDEDEDNVSQQRSNRNQVKLRQSPRKGSKQVSQRYTDDEKDGDSEADEDTKIRMPMISKKQNDESDDEYSGESASSESEADLDLEKEVKAEDEDEVSEPPVGDAELSDSDDGDYGGGKPKAVDIDKEQIGSAEESSSDIEDQLANEKRRPSPGNNRARRTEILPSQNILSSEESSDDERQPKHHVPVCPSKEDAITIAPLPGRHICVLSPDGTSRQCFALETLRMTALKCSNNNTREDNSGITHKNFLQPPHFRTAMSADLLDQIASKFGREAMDPEGSFYNRKNIQDYFAPADLDDDDNHRVRFNYDGNHFMDHVQRYMKNQMGSQDIYACPLCYSEVHRRFNRIDGNLDDDYDDYTHTDRHDPMSVLGYLDNDKFEIASLFCFKRVVLLKKHLLHDHHVNTRDVEGNELYMQYRVRDGDGLLQRWINKSWRGGPPGAGGMKIYWYSGNNQSYLHLLDQMEIAQDYNELLASSDCDDEVRQVAEAYMVKPRRFFESFQDQVQQAWGDMSSPFVRDNGDIRDFLDDGEEDSEDEVAHFVARREVEKTDYESDQNDLANKLKRKYAEPMSSEDQSSSSPLSEEESKANSDASETGHSGDKMKGYYSSEEVETDQWVLDKQMRKRKNVTRKKDTEEAENKKRVARSPAVAKRLKKQRRSNRTPSPPSEAGFAVENNVLQRATSSKKRRSIALEESSSTSTEELEIE